MPESMIAGEMRAGKRRIIITEREEYKALHPEAPGTTPSN